MEAVSLCFVPSATLNIFCSVTSRVQLNSRSSLLMIPPYSTQEIDLQKCSKGGEEKDNIHWFIVTLSLKALAITKNQIAKSYISVGPLLSPVNIMHSEDDHLSI